MKLLVTGGAGFIGSNFINHILAQRSDVRVVNFDKLTYAGNLENLTAAAEHPDYQFVRGDIAEPKAVNELLAQGFDAVINFAAETHVDRSIEDPFPFLRTNVLGTQVLLDAARQYPVRLFLHISTDEVYGSAAPGAKFREGARLQPGSPYAASKAAADLLAGAYVNTYGLPVAILRCTNNFGPCQFPEKLIPLVISNALEGKPIPVYGRGLQERDWLHVEDTCRAIAQLVEKGKPGEIYNVSAGSPRSNLSVVETILKIMGKPRSLIRFVEDRPGHDLRYALDSGKARQMLGWSPGVNFDDGLRTTISWYERNAAWLESARSGEYAAYYDRHYTRRPETLKSILK